MVRKPKVDRLTPGDIPDSAAKGKARMDKLTKGDHPDLRKRVTKGQGRGKA